VEGETRWSVRRRRYWFLDINEGVAEAVRAERHEPGSDISLFPTKEFLREILASTGTTEWLVSEGSDLPVWLIAPD
jgi:hypothetical protein